MTRPGKPDYHARQAEKRKAAFEHARLEKLKADHALVETRRAQIGSGIDLLSEEDRGYYLAGLMARARNGAD